MVYFQAQPQEEAHPLDDMSVDMADLWELAQLGDWDNLTALHARKDGTKFTASLKSDKDITLTFLGKGLTLDHNEPSGGTVKYILVHKTIIRDGEEDTYFLYVVADLKLPFQKISIKHEFREGFESSLFAGNNSITGSKDGDALIGYGGADEIRARNGDDIVRGEEADDHALGNKGNDHIKGNGGDDDLRGNIGEDRMRGNGGCDKINGGADADTIFGDRGDDRIDGWSGSDELSGGKGKDSFRFDSDLDSGTNVDKIVDFGAGKDMFQLDRDVFVGIGHKGGLAGSKFVPISDPGPDGGVIVYDQAKGKLYHDRGGSAEGGLIQFAKVTAGLHLTADDFAVVA